MNATTKIIKIIKDNKYTVIAIIAIIVLLVHMFMKKEAFTHWNARSQQRHLNFLIKKKTNFTDIEKNYINGILKKNQYFNGTVNKQLNALDKKLSYQNPKYQNPPIQIILSESK